MKPEQIKQLPSLSKTMTMGEIAKKFKVHPRTIYNWSVKLKKLGKKFYWRVGPRAKLGKKK